MRTFVILCLALAAVQAVPQGRQYTPRYDDMNIDEMIENDRLMVPYIKCILGIGKCPPEGKELKSHIAEALENNCEKCTEKQRIGARKIIAHLINSRSEYWDQLKAKYDPQNKYVKKYESELRSVA